jgi:hypothetical protein
VWGRSLPTALRSPSRFTGHRGRPLPRLRARPGVWNRPHCSLPSVERSRRGYEAPAASRSAPARPAGAAASRHPSRPRGCRCSPVRRTALDSRPATRHSCTGVGFGESPREATPQPLTGRASRRLLPHGLPTVAASSLGRSRPPRGTGHRAVSADASPPCRPAWVPLSYGFLMPFPSLPAPFPCPLWYHPRGGAEGSAWLTPCRSRPRQAVCD